MDRLTIPDVRVDEHTTRRSVIDVEAVREHAMKIYWRLKAYEDTGLDPEKISWLKETVEMAFADDPSRAERMHELAVADQEGRVIVLPCKVGTKVYRVWQKIVDYMDDPEYEVVEMEFAEGYRKDFGKTVFLMRKEAEMALAELEGKKDD